MRGKSIFAIILVLINLLGLVLLSPVLETGTYVTEWFVIIILMIFAVVLFYGLDNRRNWAWPLASIYFAASLLNMAFLYFNSSSYLLIMITVVSAIGFIISVTNIPNRVKVEVYDIGDEPEEIIVEEIKPKKSSAGKYVASKRGKSYHELGCTYVKRMSSKSKVFFDSKQGAQAKGYKAHDCVN